jgi:transcriptional regulator with XRE-family HTH domain
LLVGLKGLYAGAQMTIRAAFGKAVRIGRVRRDWTQEELARRAGLERSYLSGIERGERDPGLEVQERIARALEMSLSELQAAAEEERPRG